MRFLSALLVLTCLSLPAGAADAPKPVHGLAMHGDLKYGPDFKHFDYVNPDAPKGGTVRLGATGSFDSFNPFIIKGTAAGASGFVYDTLMDDAADEPFSQYGRLAESVTMPEDRSWVEFQLRKEARWHDGMPVTVDDVIFSFNILVKEGAPFYRFYYGNVAEVTQTGERSVKFTFKPGENRELPLIIGQLTVLPKHYWKDKDFNKTTLEPPLGSGPYKITEFEAGRFVKLSRVKDYWGKDIPVMKGYNNFDEIIFDYYRDSNVALEAFLAGRYDYKSENSSKAWATAYETPAVKKGVLVKEQIHHDRPAGMQGFAFNTRRELFSDPQVRHALAYAFNFEWSNKALFYDQYERTRSYFQNSEMAATGLPGPEELKLLEPFRADLPPEVFTQEYNPPRGDESGNIRGNLRTASKLLTEAGWVIKDGKRINAKTGKPFAFEMLLVSPLFERIALPFAKNLEKLGIAMTVRTIDTAQYRRRLDTFDFDMVVGGFGQSLSPGNEQREFWSTSAADQEGSRNIIGIKSKAVDAIVEKLIAAPSRKDLVIASRALDRVLQWGHYMIPNWHAPYDRIAYWDKFARPKVTPTRGNQFFAWWIDAAKAQSLSDRKKGL
ncbi:ABC transporter substrate-binding protein [bacterium SCSIO 12827]|nr:ABC transporter substrate-binding protein [bacterium SCSIO 12827]